MIIPATPIPIYSLLSTSKTREVFQFCFAGHTQDEATSCRRGGRSKPGHGPGRPAERQQGHAVGHFRKFLVPLKRLKGEPQTIGKPWENHRKTSKWMVHKGKSHFNGWFGGAPSLGNLWMVYFMENPSVIHVNGWYLGVPHLWKPL